MEDLLKRTPWLSRSTVLMFALVLMCGAFLAGIKVQQAFGTTAAAQSAPQIPTGFQGRQGGQGGQGGQGQQTQSSTISGKIKLVDGTTVYVETADGRIITVKTTPTTVVGTKVELKDLPVGAAVTVQGTGSETMTAGSITKTG